MNRTSPTANALLALALLAGVLPSAGSAQDSVERPRRSSEQFDRSYQIGFDYGYRTGFERGSADFRESRRRDVGDFKEYREGDQGFNSSIPKREDYRLGYRGGFSQGYEDGVNGRGFGARPGESRVAVPQSDSGGRTADGRPVLRRDDENAPGAPGDQIPADDPTSAAQTGPSRVSRDTSILIELDTPITTEFSKAGDRFTARVVDTGPYSGARVEGFIGKLVEPGRVQGKGEIVLVFKTIVFPDGTSEPIEAQVEEIVGYPGGYYPRAGGNGPLKKAPWGKPQDRNSDIDAKVDDEGRITGESATGKDVTKVGGGAVAGAILGGIIGGGSGAAVGAAVGAAAGGGAVAATRGHQIDMEPGCQLRIRTGKSARF